jgi:hypothetical protein
MLATDDRNIQGNEYNMMGPYTVRPLVREQIPQAFALVRLLVPGMSLDHWSRYADTFLRVSEYVGAGDIVTVQSDDRTIHALAFCRLRLDLRLGRILEVENFLSFDLTESKRAATALLEAAEERARRWDCGQIHLSLLEPHMKTAAPCSPLPVVMLFRDKGYRKEPLRMAKRLSPELESVSSGA